MQCHKDVKVVINALEFILFFFFGKLLFTPEYCTEVMQTPSLSSHFNRKTLIGSS